MSPAINTAVTAMQIKELQRRLNEIHIYHIGAELKEPADVRAARKVVKAFEEKNSKASNAQYAKLKARKVQIGNMILFGDRLDAAKEIEKFSKEVKAIK